MGAKVRVCVRRLPTFWQTVTLYFRDLRSAIRGAVASESSSDEAQVYRYLKTHALPTRTPPHTHTYFPRHTHTHTPVKAFTPTRGTCKLDLQLQQSQELAKYFAVSAIVSRICILYLRISMPRRVSLAALGQFKHFGKFSGIFRQRQRHFVLCI